MRMLDISPYYLENIVLTVGSTFIMSAYITQPEQLITYIFLRKLEMYALF